MIDCPGVVYDSENQNETDIVLKGVVRAERLLDPEYYIKGLLERANAESIRGIYKIDSWEDYEDFLDQLARKCGKLLKGGEPNRSTAARMVLQDWQRGKVPYHSLPPNYDITRVKKLPEEEDEQFQNMFDDPAELAKEERESVEKPDWTKKEKDEN